MKKLVLFILLAAILAFTYKSWLPLPGTFLLVKNNLEKADCIVLLNGDSYFRFKKAAELYKDGYANTIVVAPLLLEKNEPGEYYNFLSRVQSFDPSYILPKKITIRSFRYFGINPSALSFPDMEVTSTYDEAVAAKKLMLEKGFKSMILVTSAYHMRRALMLFKWVLRGTGIKIYNCTAENTIVDPGHWWRRENDVKLMVNEYLSIVQNVLYHFILRKERTSFDTC